MPVKTRSMIRNELAEAVEVFNEIAARPSVGDADVDAKIMLLAFLRRKELFQQLFSQKPELDKSIRELCVGALRGARRQDLRSICRNVLETFWPRSQSRSQARSIKTAVAQARAEVAARAEMRATELLGADFKRLMLCGEEAVDEIHRLLKRYPEQFSGFFDAHPSEQLAFRNLCWSAIMNPLTPAATQTAFAELLHLFWPGAAVVTDEDKNTACELLMPRLKADCSDWMGFILENQRVFRCIFLEDTAFAEQILSAVVVAPPSATKSSLLHLIVV